LDFREGQETEQSLARELTLEGAPIRGGGEKNYIEFWGTPNSS